MSTIIESGTARNLTSHDVGHGPEPDPAERRYVTYTNDLGSVHTIIVDIEHAAQDADALLRWFEHTRATVTHRSGPQGSSTHITPGDVLKLADEALGFVGELQPASPQGGEF